MVVCLVDYVFVTSKDDQEHLKNPDLVLTWLTEVEREKCRFMKASVTYIGCIINVQGVRADSSKFDAIKNAPASKNEEELRSFFGCINCYSKFMDKFSEIAFPLNLLLGKGQRWYWSEFRIRC